jgi:hypothetical protein
MQMDAPFYRLPLRLDIERLRAEVQQFEWFEWVPYRFMPRGYQFIDLISPFGMPMEHMGAPFLPTGNLDRCPYIKQVLASLPGVYYGAHLRWLGPGSHVDGHWDGRFYCINRPRIHIPIVSSDRAIFTIRDQGVHMGVGEVWVIDRFSYHVAGNAGETDRIHLTMDLTPDMEFFDLLAGAHKPFKYWNTDSSEATPTFIPYSAGARVQLRTERMPDGPGNSPSEVDHMTTEMVSWMRRNPIQDEPRAQAVERELQRFRVKWRSLWAEFGRTAEGWPSYVALGRETLASLREIERDGEQALVRDDIPMWKRLRDYLLLGLLASRGVRSIAPDAPAPDLDERFLIPDLLVRFAGPGEVEAFVPRKNEFLRVDQWQLILLSYIASHERLPEGADQDGDGDVVRGAIQQLLDWELLLPQANAPRPAQVIKQAELGLSADLTDLKPRVAGAAPSPEREKAAALVGPTTTLKLRGPAPHYARLRWRGYEGGTELLFLSPEGHTTLDVDVVHSLAHFAGGISPSELSEQLGGELDDESLEALRSLVSLGVLELADGASAESARR